MKIFKMMTVSAFVIGAFGCASKVLQYDKIPALETNEEYSDKIKVKELPLSQPTAVVNEPLKKHQKKSKHKKTAIIKKEPVQKPVDPFKHEPSLEDAEGFEARRPKIDPFRIGEDVDLAISYFRLTAGHLHVKVLPFNEVNGEKAYHFQISAQSNSFFSKFYAVDDVADTFVNFKTMLPYNLETRVRESKQLKEIRSYIDHEKLKADYWEKKVTKEHGEESKKLQWDILPYTQNVISAVYYMRTFIFTEGKVLQFRVTDEGKNIVAKITVVGREKLSTAIGKLDTWIIKPEFQVDGIFKPVGDIKFWLTADDRKFIVRIESAIKIGTIVAKIDHLEKGKEP